MMMVRCGCHISLSTPYLMAFARISAFRICYGVSTCCRDASESTFFMHPLIENNREALNVSHSTRRMPATLHRATRRRTTFLRTQTAHSARATLAFDLGVQLVPSGPNSVLRACRGNGSAVAAA